jgi:hypothetical protein
LTDKLRVSIATVYQPQTVIFELVQTRTGLVSYRMEFHETELRKTSRAKQLNSLQKPKQRHAVCAPEELVKQLLIDERQMDDPMGDKDDNNQVLAVQRDDQYFRDEIILSQSRACPLGNFPVYQLTIDKGKLKGIDGACMIRIIRQMYGSREVFFSNAFWL